MSEIQTNNPPNTGTARVLDEQLLFRGNWSEIVEFSYEDDKKQVRKWEGLHRNHRAEAVIIVARMQPSGRFIIIRQFRPPTNSYILEFPAGLVDPGETLETTAIRELFEETGYVGTVEKLAQDCFLLPEFFQKPFHLYKFRLMKTPQRTYSQNQKMSPENS